MEVSTCPICKKTFEKVQSLYGHLQIHGLSKSNHELLNCEKCNTRFDTLSELWRHQRIHEDLHRPFPCQICDKTFERQSQLHYHNARQHDGQRPHPCTAPGCERKFYKKSDLKTHAKLHLGVKDHPCPICQRKFSHVSNLNRHLLTHKKEKPYACHLCGQRYNQIATLNQHLKKHDVPKSIFSRNFHCHFCGLRFSHKADLNLHQKQEHETQPTPYVCRRCKRGFAQLSGISGHHCILLEEKIDIPIEHITVQEPEVVTSIIIQETVTEVVKAAEEAEIVQSEITNDSGTEDEQCKVKFEKKDGRYSCPICQKSFTRTDSVKQHLGTHRDNLAEHKCDHCDLSFGWASTLRRHKQKVHGYPSSSQLSVHCHHCPRVFKTKVHCKVHIERDHLKLREEKCDICGKAFYAKNDLLKHSRIHTGEKPFECKFCQKKFSVRSHVQRHERETHQGLRPFQCQLCKKGYTNKVQLLAHLRKIHAAECEVVDFSTEAVI